MSKEILSAEIDKQLKATFSAYIVEPLEDGIKEELSSQQKKWFGDEKNFDPDEPFLETVVDSCLQKVSAKVTKLDNSAEKHFADVSSLLRDIQDDTESLSQIIPTVKSTGDSVQDRIIALEEKQAAAFAQIALQLQNAASEEEAQTKCILQTTNASAEAICAEVKTHTGKLDEQLNGVMTTLLEQITQYRTASSAEAAAAAEQIHNLLEQNAQLQKAIDSAAVAIAQQQRSHQELRSVLEEKIAEQQKQHTKMLYLLLTINGIGLAGILAALALQLFG